MFLIAFGCGWTGKIIEQHMVSTYATYYSFLTEKQLSRLPVIAWKIENIQHIAFVAQSNPHRHRPGLPQCLKGSSSTAK
jgi:hypothetical protein